MTDEVSKEEPQKEGTDTKPQVEADPSAEATQAQTSEKVVAPPKQEEVAKPGEVDISSLPIEGLLSDPRIQRVVQSAKDRSAAVEQRRFREEQQRRTAVEVTRREDENYKRLEADEDYDAIGRRAMEQRRSAEQYNTSVASYNNLARDALRSSPEFLSLGEEVVENITNSVSNRGGNIADLATEFSRAKSAQEVARATEEVRKSIKEELSSEMEAKLTELGYSKREQQVAAGEVPSLQVENAMSGAGAEKKTIEQAYDEYNDGKMPYTEFQPYKKAFEEQQNAR